MIKNKIKDFLPSIIAVLIALIIGGVIMMTKGVNPFTAYIDMMRAAFYQPYPRSPLFSGLAGRCTVNHARRCEAITLPVACFK